jgi:hypothetical protein
MRKRPSFELAVKNGELLRMTVGFFQLLSRLNSEWIF